MHRHLITLVTALVVLCTSIGAAQSARITGTLMYRERVALTPNAVVEITLEDVSRADAPATPISTTRIERPGQVPIEFELAFDAARIEANRRYAVRARILENGQLAFATTDAALVLTQGHGQDVNLLLRGVASQTPSPVAAKVTPAVPAAPPLSRAIPLVNLPATFTGTLPCADCAGIRYQLNLFADDSFFLRTTYVGRQAAAGQDEIGSWVLSSDRRVLVLQGKRETPEYFAIRDNFTLRKLDTEGREIASAMSYDLRRASAFQPLEIRLAIRGSYRGQDNGGVFTECSTGQRWPVAAEASGAELETAYRKLARKPGEPILVSVEGRVVPRVAAASETGASRLVVDRVTNLSPGEPCAPRFVGAQLAGTYWALTDLGGTAISSAPSQGGIPSLTFRPDAQSFSGSDGCNRLSGNYDVRGDAISFASVGTLMACRGGTASGLSAALKQTARYRILGSTLDLYDAQHKRIARFEAKDMN